MICLSASTGREQWRFFAEGAVRLAPCVAEEGRSERRLASELLDQHDPCRRPAADARRKPRVHLRISNPDDDCHAAEG